MIGVSASGKSTIGKALADQLDCAFEDGDDLHPMKNVRKMQSGEPLTDADRAPWLDRVADWIGSQAAEGKNGVIACSALKRAYRDRLRKAYPNIIFVLLAPSETELRKRLRARKGHFMPPSLLRSQLRTLEYARGRRRRERPSPAAGARHRLAARRGGPDDRLPGAASRRRPAGAARAGDRWAPATAVQLAAGTAGNAAGTLLSAAAPVQRQAGALPVARERLQPGDGSAGAARVLSADAGRDRAARRHVRRALPAAFRHGGPGAPHRPHRPHGLRAARDGGASSCARCRP
ncbi:gluconokinase, partial [Oxalicibacterium sp.]|uniref:gluconokinase n=1 Tax=Oxalicibacterium sp. TaxID=2766525 RepID=UPI0039C8D01F